MARSPKILSSIKWPPMSVTLTGLVVLCGVTYIGYDYYKAVSTESTIATYQTATNHLKSSIKSAKASLTDTSLAEEQVTVSDGYQVLRNVVDAIKSSQLVLLNNLGNGFITEQEQSILTSYVSNLEDGDPLFVDVNTNASYDVRVGIQSQYNASVTTLPITFSYYANDELIYVVYASYDVVSHQITLGEVYETSATYKYHIVDAFADGTSDSQSASNDSEVTE